MTRAAGAERRDGGRGENLREVAASGGGRRGGRGGLGSMSWGCMLWRCLVRRGAGSEMMPRRCGYVRPRGPGCAPDQQDAADSGDYEERQCRPPDPVPLAQVSYHRPDCIAQLGPLADRSGQLPDRSRGRPARIVFPDQWLGVDAHRACYLANLASGEEVDPRCRVVVMLEAVDDTLPDAGPLTDIRDGRGELSCPRPRDLPPDQSTRQIPTPNAAARPHTI